MNYSEIIAQFGNKRAVALAIGAVFALTLIALLVLLIKNSRLKKEREALKTLNRRLIRELPYVHQDEESGSPTEETSEIESELVLPLRKLSPERRAEISAKVDLLYGYRRLAEQMPIIKPGLKFKIRPMPSSYNRAVWFQAWAYDNSCFVDVIRDAYGVVGEGRSGDSEDAWVLRLFKSEKDGTPVAEKIIPVGFDNNQPEIEAAIHYLLQGAIEINDGNSK